MTDFSIGEQVFVARLDAQGRGAVHAGKIMSISGASCLVKFNAGNFPWHASKLFKSVDDAKAAALALLYGKNSR